MARRGGLGRAGGLVAALRPEASAVGTITVGQVRNGTGTRHFGGVLPPSLAWAPPPTPYATPASSLALAHHLQEASRPPLVLSLQHPRSPAHSSSQTIGALWENPPESTELWAPVARDSRVNCSVPQELGQRVCAVDAQYMLLG